MKKTSFAALLILLITFFGISCGAQGDLAEYDGLLLLLYRENTGSALRDKYDSRMMYVSEGDIFHTIYIDSKNLVDINPKYNGARVKNSVVDYIIGDDGSYSLYISLDSKSDPWQLLGQDILSEEILSVREEADFIVITTSKIDPFDTNYFIRDLEKRKIITADRDTLEITSLKKLVVLPGGEPEEYYSVELENDVKYPYYEKLSKIYNHLPTRLNMENSRTITFVIDYDMPFDRRLSYTVPKGDGIVIDSYMINGVEYTIDEQLSVRGDEKASNDEIYYLTYRLRCERDGLINSTGSKTPVIEGIDYYLCWQVDWSLYGVDLIDMNDIGPLNDGKAIRSVDEMINAGEELYELLANAGFNSFKQQKYKRMVFWASKRDGYILYDYNSDKNMLGGDTSVLVDASNGRVLGYEFGE